MATGRIRTHILTSFIVAAGLLLLGGCCTTSVRTDPKPAISVTIPYGSNDSLLPYRPYTRHSSTFYVLLTNVSKRPVRVWQEWCSWGYDSLQFEVFREDGTRYLMKKKPTSFYMNFPDYVELLPRGSVVWHVDLDPARWEDLSWLRTDMVEHVKLRAIFSITDDKDSERTEQYGIWTGWSSSGLYDFILSAPSAPDTK